MAKFGTIRGRWPSKRLNLTHEYKRFVAKKLVAGVPAKQVARECGFSVMTVYKIKRAYTKLAERFPDSEATHLPADENNAPAGSVGHPRGIVDD